MAWILINSQYNLTIHAQWSEALHVNLWFLKILQASWLLEAYCADGWLPSKEYARGVKLLQMILDELRPRYTCIS